MTGRPPRAVWEKAEERLDELFADAPRFGSYGEVEMALATEIIKLPYPGLVLVRPAGRSGRK